MKKILIIVLLFSSSLKASLFFTQDQWGGRLGDQLIIYVKTKWVVHKTPNSSFLLNKFPLVQSLKMWEQEKKLSPKNLKVKELLRTMPDPKIYKDGVYKVTFWLKSPKWDSFEEVSLWYDLMEDILFRNELRKQIAPREKLNLTRPPKGKRSVAIHIRRGGGFDWPLLTEKTAGDKPSLHYADAAWPTKFPPNSFYIEQLIKLSEMFNDEPLYAYIFTDDVDPQHLVDLIKKEVNKPNIEYGCRQKGNHHTKNVLDDLFSLSLYDCLIRGGSNFPRIAQLIGNHQVVLYPMKCEWIEGKFYATEVNAYLAE